MTPEVARREVARAREKGWYKVTWHMAYVPPGQAAKPRRTYTPPPMGVEQSEFRHAVLRAVHDGHGTVSEITAALHKQHRLTRDQVLSLMRRLRRAAPWAFDMTQDADGKSLRAALTDRGRELLEAWG